MSDPTGGPPRRVRVTGPPRQAAPRPRNRVGDVAEQTAIGGIYLRSLLREQLGLAGRVIALIVLCIASLPILFRLVPRLGSTDVAGVPLAWVLLGFVVYPFLMLLGWRYLRAVERNERTFADLVRGEDPDDGAAEADR